MKIEFCLENDCPLKRYILPPGNSMEHQLHPRHFYCSIDFDFKICFSYSPICIQYFLYLFFHSFVSFFVHSKFNIIHVFLSSFFPILCYRPAFIRFIFGCIGYIQCVTCIFSENSHVEYNAFWHVLRIIGFCLSFGNSCANPIALYFVSAAFRKHFNR